MPIYIYIPNGNLFPKFNCLASAWLYWPFLGLLAPWPTPGVHRDPYTGSKVLYGLKIEYLGNNMRCCVTRPSTKHMLYIIA